MTITCIYIHFYIIVATSSEMHIPTHPTCCNLTSGERDFTICTCSSIREPRIVNVSCARHVLYGSADVREGDTMKKIG